jgi:hypothetical protein
MKPEEIYDTCTKFINDEKYIEYFISNKRAINNEINDSNNKKQKM